jgi:hypothetical protein
MIDDSRNTYSSIEKNGMTVDRTTSGSRKLLPAGGSSKKIVSTKVINIGSTKAINIGSTKAINIGSTKVINIGDDKENKKLRL